MLRQQPPRRPHSLAGRSSDPLAMQPLQDRASLNTDRRAKACVAGVETFVGRRIKLDP